MHTRPRTAYLQALWGRLTHRYGSSGHCSCYLTMWSEDQQRQQQSCPRCRISCSITDGLSLTYRPDVPALQQHWRSRAHSLFFFSDSQSLHFCGITPHLFPWLTHFSSMSPNFSVQLPVQPLQLQFCRRLGVRVSALKAGTVPSSPVHLLQPSTSPLRATLPS